jgi:hypothetical protein
MTAPENAETATAGPTPARRIFSISKWEWLGILFLAALAVFFLAISWRKWPDPIVDTGPQWYGAWRLSEGALLYHGELVWNYGPLSAYFNAALFKLFGPGMMVLVTANLIIYAAIVALAYAACRRAWGRVAACAASAVFISVFSFLHLTQIGNYNYATPYAHESTHGMLLILITAFAAARWSLQPSRGAAFVLGLCGGLATVLKPEFMLAGGAVGIAALVLRWRQRIKISLAEFALLAAGLLLPTAAFTAWFARFEPLKSAFIDASRAWWLVLVEQIQRGSTQQETFSGFNDPLHFAGVELNTALIVALVLAAIWAAGRALNGTWSMGVRLSIIISAGGLIWLATSDTISWFPRIVGGWRQVGNCLPVLCVVLLALIAWRLAREIRESKHATASTVMALMFSLLALTMLARMILRARVYHLGFYQAAFAGMAVTAAALCYLPRWTGSGLLGRRLAIAGCLVILGVGCAAIAGESIRNRVDQTEPVGAGRDRFYAITRSKDATGALVNWAAEKLRAAPPDATVSVLPGGEMINYLSRHINPVASFADLSAEDKYVEQLRRAAPDYVVWLWRDLEEFGVKHFGATNNAGHLLRAWVLENYEPFDMLGANPLTDEGLVGGVLFRRKAASPAKTSP